MDVTMVPGKYVVAVSGGVDSVVLLNLLCQQPELSLTVAHFDHGIRPDSRADRLFVQALARQYGRPFVFDAAQLGPAASEAEARQARYKFLEQVRQSSRAAAIVTAHHQDDLLETAVLNLLRGTGRKGLTSLRDRPAVRRPLLSFSKQSIINYAQAQSLEWREDSTNRDQAYRRNYVRHSLLPKLSAAQRQHWLDILSSQRVINDELDKLLANYLHLQPGARLLDRAAFTRLPHAVAKEVMASWLRANDLANFDRKTLERLTVSAKVGRPGSLAAIKDGASLEIGVTDLALRRSER